MALIPVLAHVGIALATSIAAWINVAILGALLVRRRQFRADRRLRRTVPRLLAAAVLMALLLWGLGALLFPVAGTLPRFAALAALILAGLVTYFGTAQLLGGLDLREALRMLRRRSG
ncbi:MAG: hypothetical protein B7Z53_02065 [Rhodospirillales bacterium 12-71-4]|nr:MAG: hypothetical protein B7Z53_02065 [Rhodospirillales bacterium 12-71-4]